jgi:hypothetical protein
MANASDLFGFDILGVDDYYEKMLNGSNLEKKTLLHKVAMCYTQPNFYGNASTFIVLGHLFGVRFGVLQALAKSKARRLTTKDHKSNVYLQDFGINFPSMGCDFDFVEPFFDEDINLQSKSYECHEFWLALTAGNNHYVHFSDSNFDLRNNERLGPINNLEHLTNSIWNKCISKFLLMSRNYQRPTIIQDSPTIWEQIFDNVKQTFVLNKPLLFRNMTNDILKMDFKGPFDSKLNVDDNIKNFMRMLPSNMRDLTVKCIDVSTQDIFTTEKNWDDIIKMHETKPNDRNKTSYNQVSFCLAKI